MDPITLTIIICFAGFFVVYGISKGVEAVIVETGFVETLLLMISIFFSPLFAIRKTFEDDEFNTVGKIAMSISKFLLITPFSTSAFVLTVGLLLIFLITLPFKMLLQCIFLNKESWFINKYKKARTEEKMEFQLNLE